MSTGHQHASETQAHGCSPWAITEPAITHPLPAASSSTASGKDQDHARRRCAESSGRQDRGLTITKAVELKDYLKEKYKIEPAGGGVVMAAAGGGGAAAPAEDRPSRPSSPSILEGWPTPAKKINVIKVVREITGLGLGSQGDWSKARQAVKENIAKKTAEELKKKLEDGGAKVSVKPVYIRADDAIRGLRSLQKKCPDGIDYSSDPAGYHCIRLVVKCQSVFTDLELSSRSARIDGGLESTSRSSGDNARDSTRSDAARLLPVEFSTMPMPGEVRQRPRVPGVPCVSSSTCRTGRWPGCRRRSRVIHNAHRYPTQGPLHWGDGAAHRVVSPAAVRVHRARRGSRSTVSVLFGRSSAHAHPGHSHHHPARQNATSAASATPSRCRR